MRRSRDAISQRQLLLWIGCTQALKPILNLQPQDALKVPGIARNQSTVVMARHRRNHHIPPFKRQVGSSERGLDLTSPERMVRGERHQHTTAEEFPFDTSPKRGRLGRLGGPEPQLHHSDDAGVEHIPGCFTPSLHHERVRCAPDGLAQSIGV